MVVVDKEDEAMGVIDEQDGIERTYSGDFIRDTLTIPPVLGLYTGMRICLELACGSSFVSGTPLNCTSTDLFFFFFLNTNRRRAG
jgi:hypothetical protein